MKKMLLMAAVLVSAACGEKKAEEVPAMDTSAVAPMTPSATDSAMMTPDTGMMHSDSTMARDSMAR